MSKIVLRFKVKFIVLTLVIAMCLSSCQTTPNESIVISKDSTEQKIYDSTDNQEEVCFEYTVPKHITQQYVVKEGSLVIDIDADVYIPDMDSVPVAKIAPDPITQKRADEIREYFMQGGVLVSPRVWTKSDYDEWIIEAKKGYLVDGEYVYDESCEEHVNYLISERENAPDEDIMTEIIDYSISQENGLQGRIIIDHEELGYLRITEYEVVFSGTQNYWPATETYQDHITWEEHEMPQKEIDYTLEQAVSAAQSYFADLGIESMGMVEWNKAYYGEGYTNGYEIDYGGYQIVFMREFGGMIPVPKEGCGMSPDDNFDYMPPAELEQIRVSVNEYGEVTSFYWMNPIKIIETITEHVDILSFDEIMARFEEFINMKYAYYHEREQRSLRIMDVYEIRFGLNYLPLKNNSTEFMYAPCWFFVYKDCPQYTDEQLAEMTSSGYRFLDWEDKHNDFYVFSAVDGASVSVYTQQDFDDMMEHIPSTTATPVDED